jgi:hypothetical protein
MTSIQVTLVDATLAEIICGDRDQLYLHDRNDEIRRTTEMMEVVGMVERILGLSGEEDFGAYIHKVTENAKEGNCLVTLVSRNAIVLSMQNLAVTYSILSEQLAVKAFVIEMSDYLKAVAGSVGTTRTFPQCKPWRVPTIHSSGDIEISVLSLELLPGADKTTGQDHSDFHMLDTATKAVELRVDTLIYGIPGEYISANSCRTTETCVVDMPKLLCKQTCK